MSQSAAVPSTDRDDDETPNAISDADYYAEVETLELIINLWT
jgi:hypothetical protein